jgi:predicted RND superfamily exporter protein
MDKLSTLVYADEQLEGLFTLYPNEDFDHHNINDLQKYLKQREITFSITGDRYMQKKVLDYILQILGYLPATALLLVLLTFRTQMRSIKATIFSILPAGIAALWTMGIIGWIGRPVSIVTVLAPIFTIVIGSADGLHFVSHFHDSRKQGKDREESLALTLHMVGMPMIVTTVTSIAGFLSLIVMKTQAIQQLAVFASLGILLAGFVTWYLLPLILMGNISLEPRSKRQKSDVRRCEKATDGVVVRSMRRIWGIPSIVAVAVLTISAVIGIVLLDNDFNQLSMFRNFTDVHRSFDRVMRVNGGSIPVYVFAKTDGDPLSPEYGEEFLGIEAELEASKAVGKVISIYDAYSLVNKGLDGLDSPMYPATMDQVENIGEILGGDGNPGTANLVNRTNTAVRMIVFPRNLDNATLDSISALVDSASARVENISMQTTGAPYLMRELNAEMTGNLMKSMTIAFSTIFVLLLLSMRNGKAAFISLLPIAFMTLFLFGFMGLSGISLNLFTATIFGIAIGVGVDYAVHFASVWMTFKRRGCDSVAAADQALMYTGRPITANAIGLAIGLSALLFSPLRIHVYMSLLMWVAMLSGLFLSLAFLPTVLRRLHSRAHQRR